MIYIDRIHVRCAVQQITYQGATWTIIQQDPDFVQGSFEYAGNEHWLEVRTIKASDQLLPYGLNILGCGSEICVPQLYASFIVADDPVTYQEQAIQALMAYIKTH
jgi:hypothetical protein